MECVPRHLRRLEMSEKEISNSKYMNELDNSEMCTYVGGERRWAEVGVVRDVPLHHPPFKGATPRCVDLHEVAMSAGNRGRKRRESKAMAEMWRGAAGLSRWKRRTRSGE